MSESRRFSASFQTAWDALGWAALSDFPTSRRSSRDIKEEDDAIFNDGSTETKDYTNEYKLLVIEKYFDL
ncbi:MAG: hypothetical protein ACHQ1D_05295 [Nitrososphaerales archaeon]